MKKIAFGLALAVCGAAFAGGNLLVNGDFKSGRAGWTDRTNPKQTVAFEDGVLRAKITGEVSKNEGQIVQFRDAKPNAVYKVSARIRGEVADFGYVQVKEMQGKKEGVRIVTGKNGKAGEWCTVEREITTGADTTALQVLLRFRLRENFVGKTVEFTDVRLVGVSGGAELDAPPPPPKKSEPIASVVAKAGRDQFITPDGAGAKDGSSWANARKGDRQGFEAALAALGPGNTLSVAGGEYAAPGTLSIAAGGMKGKYVAIIGVDRGVKGFARPVFTGSWKRSAPAKGSVVFDVRPGASYLRFENLEFRNVYGVMTTRGANHGLRIAKIDVDYCRDAYIFDGGMAEDLPDSGTSDLEMSDCRILHHTKKGVRTMNGVHHSKFIRCFADAGGRDYANAEPKDVFSCGFHVLGSYRGKGGPRPDHHIEFIDCEADNNYYDPTPKSYWNADGFCSEGASHDVSFIRCKAYGNTDGGWDIKTTRPQFIDCVGERNKRNFRVWSKKGEPVLFRNCTSADCWNVGNSGHDVGFWMLGGGEVTFEGCTSRNDRTSFAVEKGESTSVRIVKCKATPSAGGRVFGRLDGEVTIDTDGSVKR